MPVYCGTVKIRHAGQGLQCLDSLHERWLEAQCGGVLDSVEIALDPISQIDPLR